MSRKPAVAVKCARCGKAVEVCCCCEEPECRHVICRACLSVALRQSRPSSDATVIDDE